MEERARLKRGFLAGSSDNPKRDFIRRREEEFASALRGARIVVEDSLEMRVAAPRRAYSPARERAAELDLSLGCVLNFLINGR